MAGRGIGTELLEDGGGTALGSVDLGKELKDTLGRVKNVADAAAVGQLVRSIAGDNEGPNKDEADVAGKTINIAKDLTAMQTDKEKAARDEAEYWRLRAQEAEEQAKAKKSESRQEEIGAMGAMAQVFGTMLQEARANQTEMTKLVMGLLERQQQPQQDPLREGMVNAFLQMAMTRTDPGEEVAKWVKMAEAFGYRRPDAVGANVVNLDLARASHAMRMEERRLLLEEQRLNREMDRLEEKDKADAAAKEKNAAFLADIGKGFAAAAGGRVGGQSPQGQQQPTPERLVRYRCQKCGGVSGVPEGQPPKFCSLCGYAGEEDVPNG